MSVTGVIGGFLRGSLIAAATAAAAFGLLMVFQPFGTAAVSEPAIALSSGPSTALKGRIEVLRLALRDTEAALSAAASTAPTASAATRAQYEAQIAAAMERRDLSLRHAEAIRRALQDGTALSSLAAIRDSVVVGQLLSQQAELDAQIALESARLKANHPTMRALNAQRAALTSQIEQQASSIATALETEASLDDAQIALLESQLPPAEASPASADSATLATRAAAQRAELDALVDAYLDIPPAVATPAGRTAADPLSLPNLIVVGVAGLAAILFQLVLSSRRRRTRDKVDMAAWQADGDPELPTDLVSEPEPLRQAS